MRSFICLLLFVATSVVYASEPVPMVRHISGPDATGIFRDRKPKDPPQAPTEPPKFDFEIEDDKGEHSILVKPKDEAEDGESSFDWNAFFAFIERILPIILGLFGVAAGERFKPFQRFLNARKEAAAHIERTKVLEKQVARLVAVLAPEDDVDTEDS